MNDRISILGKRESSCMSILIRMLGLCRTPFTAAPACMISPINPIMNYEFYDSKV